MLISQTFRQADVQIRSYFSNLRDPIMMMLLVPGEECHLGFSPKSCTYPTLVTIDPLGVKIVSILLCENNNCPTLFGNFTIDNSLCICIFSKRVSDI